MRCILYLEPSSDGNELCHLLRSYKEKSMAIGVNEAQQYQPHCSITGFFNLESANTPSSQLIRHFCGIIQAHLESNNFSVKLDKVEMTDPEKSSNKQSKSVRISIKTNGFTHMADDLMTKMKPFGISIRPKPANHISLAYMASYPLFEHGNHQQQSDINSNSSLFYDSIEEEEEGRGSLGGSTKRALINYDCQAYYDLALDHFKDHLVDSSNWKLTLYQEEHSTFLQTPHNFTAIKEWNLSHLLVKSYPDR